jgi:uncharacterized membrane-anchored protein
MIRRLSDQNDGSPALYPPTSRKRQAINPMNDVTKQALSKVPAVTLGFWVIKILATTLGETGGDTVTMTIFHADKFRNWGYLVGVALFGGVLVALVVAQIVAKRFHPILYWTTIVASTTFGTTLADFADRSLGIGYTGGSLLLLCCLMATLGLWHWSQGTVSVDTVSTPKVEAYYWATITFSQTLGTALGDWLADTGGLGYEGGALVFTAALVAVAALYYWTSVSRVTLFWVAFIPDPAARRNRGRFPRQARQPRRPGPEPPAGFRGNRGHHRRADQSSAAAPRTAPRPEGGS